MLRVASAIVVAGALAAFAPPAAAAPPPGFSSEPPSHFFKRLFNEPAKAVRPKKANVNTTAAPTEETAPVPQTDASLPLVDVPLPRLRPPEDDAAAAPSTLGYAAPPVVAAPTSAMPEPRLRPDETATPPAAATLAPEMVPTKPPEATAKPPAPPVPEKLASLPEEPLPSLVRPPPAAASTCGLAIASLGVISTPLAEISEADNEACHVGAPVAIASLDGGSVDFSGRAIVDCPLAETLANWVRKTVEPAAQEAYGEDLTGLRIVDSYSCRTRDNIEGAKMSEHARGNAIDISAFRIGKRWIEVGPGWKGGGDDLAFLTTVRKSACGPFKTVLGPGADSFHTDHFHLDLEKRRTTGPSRGIVCQ